MAMPECSPARSDFLPEGFDSTGPVAVIAGQRRYPILLVERLRAAGVPVRLIAFEGETEPALVEQFPDAQKAIIKVGQLGHMLKALRKLGARYAMMAGQISPRKLFKGLHPDLKAVTLLASLKERNAATIFGAIAEEMRAIEVPLLDARAFLDDQLASPGLMTQSRPWKDLDSLRHGIQLATEMARLDVGQGVVVARGSCLAVEAYEGTDAMLERAGSFEASEPLFVKTVKPQQDFRFDVPVFGWQTLESMLRAGIRAAALKAGDVIMLDKEAVVAEAQRKKITLLGW